MTNTQRERIQKCIAECDRFIAKEKARADDLRPRPVQELLEFQIEHRIKLQAMLNGWKP